MIEEDDIVPKDIANEVFLSSSNNGCCTGRGHSRIKSILGQDNAKVLLSCAGGAKYHNSQP
jgi:hypothetical protein